MSGGNSGLPLTPPRQMYGFGHGNDAASQTRSVIWYSRMAMWYQNTVAGTIDMANDASKKLCPLIQSVEVIGCAY